MRGALLVGCLAASAALAPWAPVSAAPAPQLNVEGIVKELSGPPASQTPSSGDCPQGFAKGDDGICEPLVGPNFGFSIPGRPRSGAAQAESRPGAPGRPATPAAAAARAPQADLLLTFDLNSANLTDQGISNAKVFVQALKDPRLANMKFEIEGHTDATGSREYNLVLSQRRADAVKRFLVSQGISPDRLTAVGYGYDRLANAADPKGAENRRVVARRLQ